MKFFMPLVVRKATYVLCQGKSWKNFYQEISGSENDKFVIINNWIDIGPYMQDRIDTTDTAVNIIFIGWFEEYKGIKDLLEALKLLSDKHLRFTCDVYGNGSLFHYAQDFIEKYNLESYVFLRGWANKESKFAALKKADIYILPSHYEGFPNALLEAMASKLAVIATKIGPISDIIEHKTNGLLAEINNPSNLAYQIEELLSSKTLREHLAINARETVINKFTVKTAIEKFEKIF